MQEWAIITISTMSEAIEILTKLAKAGYEATVLRTISGKIIIKVGERNAK